MLTFFHYSDSFYWNSFLLFSLIWIHRIFVRLGEYDTETDPDCIQIEDDKDCNETPFDSPPESKNSIEFQYF